MTEKTLAALLCERVTEFANSPKAVEMIDTGIEKMFKGVVDDCFGHYSDMSKMVKKTVEAAMPANMSSMFELKRYNAIIAESMKRLWESAELETDMQKRLAELLDETLKAHDYPPVILLSEFMNAFVEDNKREAFESGWEAPKVIYEDDGEGFCHLYFDKDPTESSYSTRSKYSLEYRIAMHIADNETHNVKDWREQDIALPVGSVYSALLNCNPISSNFNPGKFDRIVQAVYFGLSKIAIDCDPEDICYPCHD